MPAKPKPKTTTRAGLDSAIWSVCDILRRSNCAGALQYVPELTWILFLRITNAKAVEATRTAADLIALIRHRSREIDDILGRLEKV